MKINQKSPLDNYKDLPPGNYVVIPEEQYEELLMLTKQLLIGVSLLIDRETLIEPFFSIVKDHAKLIHDLKLIPEIKSKPKTCICQGFYRHPNCPIHGVKRS